MFLFQPFSFSGSTGRTAWKRERKNRATASPVARRNPSFVIFNDSFANRKSKPGAVRLAMSKERLEQVRRYIGRNARAGIFNSHDHITFRQYEAQHDPPAAGHHVDGIAHQIGKHVRKSMSIK